MVYTYTGIFRVVTTVGEQEKNLFLGGKREKGWGSFFGELLAGRSEEIMCDRRCLSSLTFLEVVAFNTFVGFGNTYGSLQWKV